MSLLPPHIPRRLKRPMETSPRLPNRIEPTIPLHAANPRRMERMFGEPFNQSTQAPWRITSPLLEEEKILNDDAREAFNKLSQSVDDFLNVLTKAATLRRDIFVALSLFESMCDTTAQLDKLWRLVELYCMIKGVRDPENTFATNNAKPAEANDPPHQTPPKRPRKRRAGRMGRLLCPPCRTAKKGFECVPDPNDPSRCLECTRRGLKCGERTWGAKRAARMSQEATENRVRSMEQWSVPENGENDPSTLRSDDGFTGVSVPKGSGTISHPSTFTPPVPQVFLEHKQSVNRRTVAGNKLDPNLPPTINAADINHVHERSEPVRHPLTPTRDQATLSDDTIHAKAARILRLQWPGLDPGEITSSVLWAVRLDNEGPIDEQSPLVASDHSSLLSESLVMSSQESGVSIQSHSGIQQLANPYNHLREIEDWNAGCLFLNSAPPINWLSASGNLAEEDVNDYLA